MLTKVFICHLYVVILSDLAGTFRPTANPSASPSVTPSKSLIPSPLPSVSASDPPTLPPGKTAPPTKPPTLQGTEGLVKVPIEEVAEFARNRRLSQSFDWNYTNAEEWCASKEPLGVFRLPRHEEICANGKKELPTSVEGVNSNNAWIPIQHSVASNSWVNIGTKLWYAVCIEYIVRGEEQVNPAKESPGYFYCFDKRYTGAPSSSPSSAPTSEPSSKPSISPSSKPSRFPTAQPSREPSSQPTNADCSDLYICGEDKNGNPRFPMCTIKEEKGKITYESKCKKSKDVDGLVADEKFLECGCCPDHLEDDPPKFCFTDETRWLEDEVSIPNPNMKPLYQSHVTQEAVSSSISEAIMEESDQGHSQGKNQLEQKMISPKIDNGALELIESMMKLQQEQFQRQEQQFMVVLMLMFGGFFLIIAAVVYGNLRAARRPVV